MIIIGFLWFVVTVVADFMAKRWMLKGEPQVEISPVALLYLLQAMLWVTALGNGLSMSKGSIAFSCMGILAGVAIGVGMGEHLSATNWAGFVMACGAIVLVAV